MGLVLHMLGQEEFTTYGLSKNGGGTYGSRLRRNQSNPNTTQILACVSLIMYEPEYA